MFALLLAAAASKLLLLNEERQFVQWMRSTNQFYTGDEYHFRLGLFISHVRYVQEFNKQNSLTFKVGINKFSCFTPAEYKSILGAKRVDDLKNIQSIIKQPQTVGRRRTAPESFDWREKSVVNAIKDQASCGSCWAFSAITTAESAYAIQTGKLLSFSEQNIVDCVASCFGCNGGWPGNALQHVIKNQDGKFNSEVDYPYTAVDGTCVFDADKPIGNISGYTQVTKADENDLLEKVATLGVASVCIDAGHPDFMSYSSGIFVSTVCSPFFLDHAVGCVGYGAEDGVEFWIVRNSWGTTWGEQGYVRMARNHNNMCGISTTALVATA